MPYLKKEQKDYFKLVLEALDHVSIAGPGELNYLITELINRYARNHTKNYQMMNDIVGALESCKAEFQRRIVGPYEKLKISLNGDAYEGDILK